MNSNNRYQKHLIKRIREFLIDTSKLNLDTDAAQAVAHMEQALHLLGSGTKDGRTRVTADEKIEMIQLRKEGKSWRWLSEYYGCSVNTCRQICDPAFKERWNKYHLMRYHESKT